IRHEPSMVVHPARKKAAVASVASGGAAASAPAASVAAGGGVAVKAAADNTSAASYTVSKSDTLGKIARRFGGATAASRNQFMDWVFQHNSAAFYGDMNRLRAGARLALPENAATSGTQVAAAGGASARPSVAAAAPQAGAQASTAQVA